MFNSPRKILFRSVGSFIFIAIFLFSYFRYAKYIKGPEIVSINMKTFMSVDEPFLSANAFVKNTKSVTINGRDVLLKNKEKFNEILVFSSGTNIIEVGLEDTFGNKKTYIYSIYYTSQKSENPKTIIEARIDLADMQIDEELIINDE